MVLLLDERLVPVFAGEFVLVLDLLRLLALEILLLLTKKFTLALLKLEGGFLMKGQVLLLLELLVETSLPLNLGQRLLIVYLVYSVHVLLLQLLLVQTEPQLLLLRLVLRLANHRLLLLLIPLPLQATRFEVLEVLDALVLLPVLLDERLVRLLGLQHRDTQLE